MKLIYTTDELKQRSEEWNDLRNPKEGVRIGASDVATLLGVNKYEKPHTLFKRKIGKLKPKTMNSAMQRGVDLEDKAIEAVIEELKFDGIEKPNPIPFVCIHPKHTYIAVSFDGVDIDNNFIIEVKCPSTAKNFISVFENGIPEHYKPQVQLQLFMANEHWGIKTAHFGSYYPDGAYVTDYRVFKEYLKTIIVRTVEYDEHYCQEMCKVIEKFITNVKTKTWDNEEYEETLTNFKNNVTNDNN